MTRPNHEETLREARANGIPRHTAVNVIYDGMVWGKLSEIKRRCRHGAWTFLAVCRGPRCWRFTATKDGAQADTALVGSLNAAKLRAAVLVRRERAT